LPADLAPLAATSVYLPALVLLELAALCLFPAARAPLAAPCLLRAVPLPLVLAATCLCLAAPPHWLAVQPLLLAVPLLAVLAVLSCWKAALVLEARADLFLCDLPPLLWEVDLLQSALLLLLPLLVQFVFRLAILSPLLVVLPLLRAPVWVREVAMWF
jgi:hypothetical protein